MAGDDDTLPRPDVPAASPPIAADLVGRTIAQFRIVARLGEGGMGVVYRAFDTKLRRDVALKVLGARYVVDDRNKELIFREARSAAALVHPNIAAIYDTLEVDGLALLAMEFIDGDTLRARGRVPPAEALRIVREIAAGLARAHAAGVVHRDLKPDNVMLTRDGHVKLLDFGLAKAVAEPEPLVSGSSPGAFAATVPASSTRTQGRIMGTPAYMSPEQRRGDVVDARTDVFAFGVVCRELFGRSRQLHAVIDRCMRDDRGARYPNGAELLAALPARLPRSHWPVALGGAIVVAGVVAVLSTRGDASRRPSEGAFREVPIAQHVVQIPSPALDSNGTRIVRGSSRPSHLLIDEVGGMERELEVPKEVGGVGELSFERGEQALLVLGYPEDPNAKGPSLWRVPLDNQRATRRAAEVPGTVVQASPDGRHLAWVGIDGLYVSDRDGAARSRLAPNPQGHSIFNLAWSPDGRALATVVTSQRCGHDAWVDLVELEGGRTRRLISDPRFTSQNCTHAIAWPSQRQLLVAREPSGSDPAVEILDLDPSADDPEPRTVARWSGVEVQVLDAAAGRIMVQRTTTRDELVTARLDADDRRAAPLDEQPLPARDAPIGFLADGRLVVSPSGPTGRDFFTLEHGKPIPFAHVAHAVEGALSTVHASSVLTWQRDASCQLIEVSPSGTRAVPVRDLRCGARIQCAVGSGRCFAAEPASEATTDFVEIDLGTGTRTQIYHLMKDLSSWAVSPDGRTLAIDLIAGTAVSLIDVDAHTARDLAVLPEGRTEDLAFSTDGRRVYLTVNALSARMAVDAVSLDGHVEELFRTSGPDMWIHGPVVSPDGAQLVLAQRSYDFDVVLLEPEH